MGLRGLAFLGLLLLPALAQVLTLPELRARTYGEGGFRVERGLGEGPRFTRVQFSYLSDGLRVHGFANLPKGRGPFPVVVVLHGYVEPSRYRLLAYTTPYADFLAERGFLVLHPNYRGHPPSQGEPASGLRHAYAVDVLHLLAGVRQGAFPQADPSRIALFGHSMGGGVAQVVALVDRGLKGVVLYGSMSGDERRNLERIRFWSRGRRGGELLTLPPKVLEQASAWTYLGEVSLPFSVHHGTQDAQVPPEWSWELCRRLKALGKPVECFSYPAGHLFRGEAEGRFRERVLAFLARVLR
ncbi:MAG: alpha/beta fold hydrolase [Thermus sp.]|uniref:alpha/beta hydrolase family protein n=1 Tax=Thermus sp. TaxID=275 RepID=UPI0025F3A56E|nr:alpha/beta fold hydrolase [Thermus sp.]MCS6868971.1 alpha/beta fold hydrolase [Thermus sp.]MCS7218946.1 alpha/beta fold hydrolase [Thermus sp.]MDW8017325.1 alpha/beta fold hydrolase [Thermus sp.]MDW8356875.1 alpha/beta fold hydrolase [Thermus sp.]